MLFTSKITFTCPYGKLHFYIKNNIFRKKWAEILDDWNQIDFQKEVGKNVLGCWLGVPNKYTLLGIPKQNPKKMYAHFFQKIDLIPIIQTIFHLIHETKMCTTVNYA